MNYQGWRDIQASKMQEKDMMGICFFCGEPVHQGVFHLHVQQEHPEIWNRFMRKGRWTMSFKYLRLDLDDLYTEGYYYTDYDIGGEGHSIMIKAEDKEAFLDAFAAQWRKNAEALLEGVSARDAEWIDERSEGDGQ